MGLVALSFLEQVEPHLVRFLRFIVYDLVSELILSSTQEHANTSLDMCASCLTFALRDPMLLSCQCFEIYPNLHVKCPAVASDENAFILFPPRHRMQHN
jgi:hypothetical protein